MLRTFLGVQEAAVRRGIYCRPLSGYTAEAGSISRRVGRLTQRTKWQIVWMFFGTDPCELER